MIKLIIVECPEIDERRNPVRYKENGRSSLEMRTMRGRERVRASRLEEIRHEYRSCCRCPATRETEIETETTLAESGVLAGKRRRDSLDERAKKIKNICQGVTQRRLLLRRGFDAI